MKSSLHDCVVSRQLSLELLLYSNMSILFPCRYSPAEGSMKPASPLSASAAQPPFPYLSLLTRTDCGCQPSCPDSPQQPAEKRLELRPFPVQPLLPLLPMQSKANNQYSLHHEWWWWSTTGPSYWIKLKTSQTSKAVPAQHKSCRSSVYE